MSYRNLLAILGIACALYLVWSFALATWNGTKMSAYNIGAIIAACLAFWSVLALFLFAALAILKGLVLWRDRRLSNKIANHLVHDLPAIKKTSQRKYYLSNKKFKKASPTIILIAFYAFLLALLWWLTPNFLLLISAAAALTIIASILNFLASRSGR